MGDGRLHWNGLRALGVDDASLDSFPEEFKQGMVARASILGDAGENILKLGRWARAFRPSRHRYLVRSGCAGAGAMPNRARQTRCSLRRR